MTVWYLARAAGLAALIALSMSTALGALVSGRLGALSRRVVVQYAHRSAALVGVGLLVVHVTAMILDSQSGISLANVVIPFSSSYRPLAVALGSVSMYLMVMLIVTGLARGRMTSSLRAVRAWRAIHLTAYGLWGLANLHGFFAGSDAGLTWVRGLYVGLLAIVGAAIVVRLRSNAASLRSPLALGRAAPAPVVAQAVVGGRR